MQGPWKSREDIEAHQLLRLRELIGRVLHGNSFYSRKWKRSGAGALPASLGDFVRDYPFTLKQELVDDQKASPPYGTNLTYPLDHYVRFHQTSGTTANPLRWIDTAANWESLVEAWAEVFRAAEVGAGDRIFFAFSFGPFIGFWLAFDAGQRLGALCIPGGGLSSAARLKLLLEAQATVICCTPTYGLHLGEVARREKIDLGTSMVRRLIVAGEAGGSIPATRAKLESLWPGAAICDHHGMTETGPVTYECPQNPGMLHLIESAFFAEVLDESGKSSRDGRGELVLTSLVRDGTPLLRYRTGDLVRLRRLETPCSCGRLEAVLEGGILGRVDEMVVIRGVNVFPAAIEEVVRKFPEIEEYQVIVRDSGAMKELKVLIETNSEPSRAAALAASLGAALHTCLNLRVPVEVREPGALPRFEMKSRRWIRQTSDAG
jgi:phenylacetate-CoA ligase